MSRNFLINGGVRARDLLVVLHHHSRSRLSDSISTPSALPLSRSYVKSHLLSSKFKSSSSSSSSILSSSASSSSLAAVATRNGFVGWYLGMIEARPVLTKSLTAGAIFTAADVSSQIISWESDYSLDWMRTMRMASYGVLISGPSLHLWFNFVSKVLPKRDVYTTFKKMAIGQTIYGPIMTTIFFSFNAVLQGETTSEIIARLKRDLIPTFKSGLVYWPMCDFITFRFIPVRLQPLVSNSFSFLWTIYITYMASLEKPSVEKIATD
ncbi:uncharacterized protein [Typha angustifolia]|uniref:uncharacterized protein n=1 Tax=Typha angustifolia TaxID=59011 RepID=UPI003C2F1F32